MKLDYTDPLHDLITKEMGITDEEDKDIINQMTALALGTVMAMCACPELVELGAMNRPARVKRGVTVQSELWNPHIIGAKYRIERPASEPGDGTHASPRMHWRCGHFRNQPYGPERALRRMKWKRPMLGNPVQEKEQN